MVKRLILIDGNAILHRAYHALPPLTTKKGEPINAVYGLISMLLRIVTDLKPTHLTVAFDEKEPTFRHKELPTYQAHRPPMESSLSSQFEKARDFLNAAGIPIFSKPGYEADDVIGTIAYSVGHMPNSEVVIVTGDRDILQLVNGKVRVYMPVKGMSEGKLFGIEAVIEKLGVKPSKIPLYKALVGDPSDNYPGVAGIGPKTAVNLIEKFKDLDHIYSNLDKINKSVSEKLAKNKESAYISLKLATIVKDAPVEFDVEKAKEWDLDGSRVMKLFSEYGFKTLTERVKKVGKELDKQKQMSLI